MIGLNGGSVDVFLQMVNMVLVPWRVGAVIGNEYGIQEQNYDVLLQGSAVTAVFPHRNLILEI